MSNNRRFFSQLNTRQHEVLVCLLAGDSNPEIASYCELSVSSVKRYVGQLMKAAEVERRQDLRDHWAPADYDLAA